MVVQRLIPNLTDVTFMTKEGAKLFVNSPNALDENRAEKLDTAKKQIMLQRTQQMLTQYTTQRQSFSVQ